jgi:hypothetical protein
MPPRSLTRRPHRCDEIAIDSAISVTVGVPLLESPTDADDLDRLSIHPYRVSLIAHQRFHAEPSRLPNMLRGTFEISFRRLVCHDLSLDCRACPLVGTCPYPAVFRPTPPPGSDRLSRAQDLPRPFVFEIGDMHTMEFRPGDTLNVGITLFGEANRFLPYFIVALRALADRGLGSARGRLRLARVTAKTSGGEQEVFEEASSVIRSYGQGLRLRDLVRPEDADAQRIRVRFLSPTTLKRNGHLVEQPSFADLVCRARDRVSALSSFFGDGPVEMDFAGVADKAAQVRTVDCRVEWQRRARRSSRTGDVHEISGFSGEAVYDGGLGDWMPLLRLAEASHVGKYAVWGNGWMAADVLPQGDT